MNQNNFWKWVLVFFLLIWAAYSIYPPSSRNLVDEFAEGPRHVVDEGGQAHRPARYVKHGFRNWAAADHVHVNDRLDSRLEFRFGV